MTTGESPVTRPLSLGTAGPADSALVARQALNPIVRLDCAGVPRPALAQSWSADSSGRAWTVVLADSGPGAGELAASWRERPTAAEMLRLAGVESVLALDERRLIVLLARPAHSLPAVLADPSLALEAGPGSAAFVLPSQQGSDPRDALDRGADLLRTDDPAVLEYARSNPDLMVFPLPWSRTYVLVAPHGVASSAILPDTSAGFRRALARDAVAGEARGAEPPYWWEDRAFCGHPQALGSSTRPLTATLLYARGDRIARALAERAVALADASGLAARGVAPEELRNELRAGRARGYVVAVPRLALVPCRDVADWPAGAEVIPLVDARLSAVVRRGAGSLAVEWDGTLRPVTSP